MGLIEDSITCSESGGQDVFWRYPVRPHPNRPEGEQNPVLCEQCCELCVRGHTFVLWPWLWFDWCSHRDQLRSPSPLILKSRGWAHVEGTLGVPVLPTQGGKGTQGQSLSCIFG